MHVEEVRRAVVAFGGEHGVPRAVLANVAIAVSEILTNAGLHGDADTLTVEADIREHEVRVVMRGGTVRLTPEANGATTPMRMVVVAALADEFRVASTGDGRREIAMSFRRTAPAGDAGESVERPVRLG